MSFVGSFSGAYNNMTGGEQKRKLERTSLMSQARHQAMLRQATTSGAQDQLVCAIFFTSILLACVQFQCIPLS